MSTQLLALPRRKPPDREEASGLPPVCNSVSSVCPRRLYVVYTQKTLQLVISMGDKTLKKSLIINQCSYSCYWIHG